MSSGRWLSGEITLSLWVLALGTPHPAAAQIPVLDAGDEFKAEGANCSGLKLKGASGVVGMRHTYYFVGTCYDGQRQFPAEAKVAWDRKAYSLSEDFQILGTFINSAGKSYAGHVRSVFKCNDDPTVIPQAACNGVGHTNETGAKFLSRPYVELRRPITKGKTTLAEAKALSAAAAAAVAAAVNAIRLSH
jgi:hypothetical protein